MKWALRLVSSTPQKNFDVGATIVQLKSNQLFFVYRVIGPLGELKLPAPSQFANLSKGADLWKTTCFECFFFSEHGPNYYELNVSAEGTYDVMAFDKYRAKSASNAEKLLEISNLSVDQKPSEYLVAFDLKVNFEGNFKLSPTVILDCNTKVPSHEPFCFALAHESQKADFHKIDGLEKLAPSLVI